MQILQIRDRAGSIFVKYELDGAVATLSSGATPPQAFVDALDGLKAVVRSILDVSDQWMGRVKVTGVTLTKCGDDNAKVVLVARRDYVVGGSPLNLATPYRFMHAGAEEDGGNELALLPCDAAAIKELCVQAEAYVKSNPTMRQFYLPGFGGAAETAQQPETPPATEPAAPVAEVDVLPPVVDGADDEPSETANNVTQFPAQTPPKRGRRSAAAD